jgi:hypothetical protein
MEERESSCFDVFVAEQLLDGANVVAVFEQVGGEGVAEVCGLTRLGMPAALAVVRMAFCGPLAAAW